MTEASYGEGMTTGPTSADLALPGGGTLRVHDTGGDGFPVVWHHGTGNTGEPPRPLLAAAARLGLRLVGFDRPGYGGSSAFPGRSVADVAGLAAAVADHVGSTRFAVMGHSGGGPHALACAALRPDRVTAVVAVSGPAPSRRSSRRPRLVLRFRTLRRSLPAGRGARSRGSGGLRGVGRRGRLRFPFPG